SRWGWRWRSGCRRPGACVACASSTRWPGTGDPMAWLNQVAQITLINLRNVPRRLGTSLVVVIGIAGVVGVLVSVLAMAEGFPHTLAHTGRPARGVILRRGAEAE